MAASLRSRRPTPGPAVPRELLEGRLTAISDDAFTGVIGVQAHRLLLQQSQFCLPHHQTHVTEQPQMEEQA